MAAGWLIGYGRQTNLVGRTSNWEVTSRGFHLPHFQLRASALKKEIHVRNGKRRRAWTSVQVRELKSMARKKTPARKIAKSLKRTEGATRQKAFSLGLSLDTRA
jgi:hypothetical protein